MLANTYDTPQTHRPVAMIFLTNLSNSQFINSTTESSGPCPIGICRTLEQREGGVLVAGVEVRSGAGGGGASLADDLLEEVLDHESD